MMNFYRFLESYNKDEIKRVATNISYHLHDAENIASLAKDYANLHDEDVYEVLFKILFSGNSYRAVGSVLIKKPVTLINNIKFQPGKTHYSLKASNDWALYLDDVPIKMKSNDEHEMSNKEILEYIKDHFTPSKFLQKYSKSSFMEFYKEISATLGNLNHVIRVLLNRYQAFPEAEKYWQDIEYLKYLSTLNLDEMFINYLNKLVKSGEKESYHVLNFLIELLTNYELVGDL